MRSPTFTGKVKGWAIAPSNLPCGNAKDAEGAGGDRFIYFNYKKAMSRVLKGTI
ncbi:hypothetical protein [Microcoleus sp. B9-D4]|uniref:hypothetical protein n=1 Tax=Microcoleus sp. B9-D4 TaxID=2818711 RepID=UPI002FCF50A2